MSELSDRGGDGEREDRTFGVELAVNFNHNDNMTNSYRSPIVTSFKTLHLGSDDLQENRAIDSSMMTTKKRSRDEDCVKESRVLKKRRRVLDQREVSKRTADRAKSDVPNKNLKNDNFLVDFSDTQDQNLSKQAELLKSNDTNTKFSLESKDSESISPTCSSHTMVSQLQTSCSESEDCKTKLTKGTPLIVSNSVSSEEQIAWLTSPTPPKCFDYYRLLVQERLKALQEVWTENDRLEAEITQIKAQNAELEPLSDQILALHQILQETTLEN